MIPVNVRIVCATNVEIEKALESGEFRKDLYDRISGKIMHIPDLDERKEDIPLLSHFFFRKYCELEHVKLGFDVNENIFCQLQSAEDITNVRVLENKIHDLVVRLKSHPSPTVGAIEQYLSGEKEYEKTGSYHLARLEQEELKLLKTFFKNRFHYASTARVMYKDKEKRAVIKKKILSIYLRLGSKFGYKEVQVAEYLLKEGMFEPDEVTDVETDILNGYKRVSRQYPVDKGKPIYYKKDIPLIEELKELHSELS